MTAARGRGWSRVTVAVLGALAALAATREARAAGGAPERQRQLSATARAHHLRGETLYVAEQYGQALAEFEAGFAVLPLPGFLVNIGQCHRRMGDLAGARTAFERFLALAPDSPFAPEVRDLIRELVLTPPPLEVSAAAPVAAPAPREAPAVVALAPAVVNEPTRAAPLAALAPTPAAPASASALVGNRIRAAPPAPVRRRRTSAASWWLWGGVAVTAVVVSAIVMGAGGGTNTTIHDGSLGTLRR